MGERPSPSSPQEQAEPRLEAGEGLDVTACSASSLFDSVVRKYPWPEGYVPKCIPQDFDVWEILMWEDAINTCFMREEEYVRIKSEIKSSLESSGNHIQPLSNQPSPSSQQ